LINITSQAQSVMRECLEARAERDLWSLLEIFTRANLIVDIDNQSKFVFVLFCFPILISLFFVQYLLFFVFTIFRCMSCNTPFLGMTMCGILVFLQISYRICFEFAYSFYTFIAHNISDIQILCFFKFYCTEI
jgi:hypothetical protein